jgi:hypothetical protein
VVSLDFFIFSIFFVFCIISSHQYSRYVLLSLTFFLFVYENIWILEYSTIMKIVFEIKCLLGLE